LRRGLPSESC